MRTKMQANEPWADLLAREARRRGDGRSGVADDVGFATSAMRCGHVAEVLVRLIGHLDPNVRIGALDIVREQAPLFRRELPGQRFAKLHRAVERACEDQTLNDYAHDDQLAELDVIRVCEVAKVALGSLEAGQRSQYAQDEERTESSRTTATGAGQ